MLRLLQSQIEELKGNKESAPAEGTGEATTESSGGGSVPASGSTDSETTGLPEASNNDEIL